VSDAPADLAEPGSRSEPGWAGPFKEGLAATGWMVLATQALAFVVYFAAGRPFRPWSFVKIGWLYLLASSRVGLRVTVGSALSSLVNAGAPGETVYRVHLALLTFTVLAAWLLFRAGRRAAGASKSSPAQSCLAGAAVAIPYAAIAFLGSFLAVVRFPAQGIPEIRPIALQSLLLPLITAAVFGAAGGLSAARGRIGRTRGAGVALRSAAGGWTAFLWAAALAFAGLLIVAAVYPDATGAYARWLSDHGHAGALLFAHQLLALPNHAVFVLAPSLGACDVLAGGGRTADALCSGSSIDPSLLLYVPFSHGVPAAADLGMSVRSNPAAWRAFLLVSLAATLIGGWRAGVGESRWGRRLGAGAGAGVGFAVLVSLAAWASSATLAIPAGGGKPAVVVRFGPDLARTWWLALAWGVPGCALGALLARLGDQEGSPVPEPGDPVEPVPVPGDPEPAAPLLPRPTSE
jgi:hypothetical protein